VKRLLLRSTAFVRATRRMLRKHPQAAEAVQAALELLTEDAFHPQLRAHKLKGKLEGSWACSAGYDLRIVLTFVPDEDSDRRLLCLPVIRPRASEGPFPPRCTTC
jgi:mRNA-degrading endonuclease YafQ of YafQ-DinJ toxin-antitoxin module